MPRPGTGKGTEEDEISFLISDKIVNWLKYRKRTCLYWWLSRVIGRPKKRCVQKLQEFTNFGTYIIETAKMLVITVTLAILQ